MIKNMLPSGFISQTYNRKDVISSTSNYLLQSDSRVSLISSIAAGTASANKALVLDSSSNIIGLNSLQTNKIIYDTAPSYYSSISGTAGGNLVIDVGNGGSLSTCVIQNKLTQNGSVCQFKAIGTASCDVQYYLTTGRGNWFGLGSTSTTHLGITCNGNTTIWCDYMNNNIGMFNTSPNSAYKLDLTGNAHVSALGVNQYTQSAMIDVVGSATYLDGTGFNRCFRASGSNASPVQMEIQCNTGASTTSANACFIGTITANDLKFGTGDSTKMIITASNGYVGIGTSFPAAPLDVSGTLATYTIGAGGTASAWSYNVQTNSYSSLGLGPYSASNMAALFRGNIFVNNTVFTSSDRRLKEQITDYDISFDHYNQLKPKIYKYKNEDRMKYGFIAQDMLQTFGELVSFNENEKLKKEDENDPDDGIQLNIDYSQMTAINCVIIKKLIAKIDALEQEIQSLLDSGSYAQWKKSKN